MVPDTPDRGLCHPRRTGRDSGYALAGHAQTVTE